MMEEMREHGSVHLHIVKWGGYKAREAASSCAFSKKFHYYSPNSAMQMQNEN